MPVIIIATIAVAAVCFVGYGVERLWGLHISDAALRSTLETGISLSALAGAILLLAHFRQTRLLRDLLLLTMLATVALTDFVFNALPAFHYKTGIYGAGAKMALTMLVAATFVAVAFAPAQRRVVVPGRMAGVAAMLALGWVALGELVDLLAGPVTAHGPVGLDAPVSTAVGLICFVLLLVSGVGFADRRGLGDAEAKLLTGAALLLAGTQLGRLVHPVLPAAWVTPADALRVGAWTLLTAACVLLYRKSVHQSTHDAIAAERRRIARDLHDGLAQDLAFIALYSGRLARQFGADHPVAIAAQRALATSRGQIVDLEASHAPSTGAALREVASDMSVRHGVEVVVNVDDGADRGRSDSERRELVRIAREAIANAIRHGGASRIAVTLGSRRDDLLLRISDDGVGLPECDQPAAPTAGTGLGMRTMDARATQIGARLRADRREQGGTEIDVIAVGSGAHPER